MEEISLLIKRGDLSITITQDKISAFKVLDDEPYFENVRDSIPDGDIAKYKQAYSAFMEIINSK